MNSLIPKLIMLISGERIIAGVREVVDDSGKGVCLVLKCAYILNMFPVGEVDENNNPSQYSVNFTKWQPYSADEEYNIPYFSIITVCDVDTKILNVYLEKFGDQLNDTDTLPAIDPDIMPEESAVSDS